MSDCTESRRKAALRALEVFSCENGFEIKDCQMDEVSESGRVFFACVAPDGRDFGIGYKVAP